MSKNIKYITINQNRDNFLLGKQEALVTGLFIDEILVDKLGFTRKQITNDTVFKEYTGSQRPDLLISEIEYDHKIKNDKNFIENLVAYAEIKDASIIDDKNWKEAKKKGSEKAKKLKIPFYIVSNTNTSVFYNTQTSKELKLNNNIIHEFQTIDILRLIKNKLLKNPTESNILTNADSLSVISEAIFNRKLWELAKVYRNITFENNVQKIDFTIGFISLEYFEEKELLHEQHDKTKIYWSNCNDGKNISNEKLVANLGQYVQRLKQESQFGEFSIFMENVRSLIIGKDTVRAIIDKDDVKRIYDIVDSMKPLHGCGFDLFGAVYEIFASTKDKKDFGEYFTRRHYAYILAKLLLKKEQYFNKDQQFSILDPACGTGGFLTESFKILKQQYIETRTLNNISKKFLSQNCFWGFDVRPENISRTKLNMFLVGDGHTNMESQNTLKHSFQDKKWDYIITNPPYGAGTIKAETSVISSNRTEIAFLYKIIDLLRDGGHACIIQPDGILENSTFAELRNDLLKKCDIDAIISLPKFAFAPYTKEKTYAIYITKKNKQITSVQKKPIWMYIVDNDGLANSDKRFPTKLRDNKGGWLHDEISGWVNGSGEEMLGLLECRWLSFDDSDSDGTEWINEKGQQVKMRKGGKVRMSQITKQNYYSLLPEFHLRQAKYDFITLKQLSDEIKSIENDIKQFTGV